MTTIFKEFQPHSRDRSVEDRRRHRELVEKSIKENIGSIISDESIIGKAKNKKIKIPIKGLKEYYFKHGHNQKKKKVKKYQRKNMEKVKMEKKAQEMMKVKRFMKRKLQ